MASNAPLQEQQDDLPGGLAGMRWSGAVPLLSSLFAANSAIAFAAWWVLIR